MTARRLRRKNKTDVKRFLYVPLPMLVDCADVETRRKLLNGPLDCRNPLNYVEGPCKLLMQWREARNTQKRSNSGSPRRETASHNVVGKSPPQKLASCAPFGRKSGRPLPTGKA
jgi:hypothetical protein